MHFNRAHGYGVKVFAKGDRHEGYYLNDKRSGFGTYFWANGDRFKGNWSEGEYAMLYYIRCSCLRLSNVLRDSNIISTALTVHITLCQTAAVNYMC
jgi:MORN repeat